MSDGNNNNSFRNLLDGWNNPYGGSSSTPTWNNPNVGSSSNPNWDNPNILGMSSQELFQQHQELQHWQQSQQNTLNTDFSNLQFTQPTQHSQHSHTETHEVPDSPTSPAKPKGRIKRKAKKSKDPEPNEAQEEGEHNVHTKWTPSEEKLFAECWIAASEDERVGRSQARDTFWQHVQREFNRNNFMNSNKDMLQSKRKTLNHACNKFNAIFKQAERDIKSGESPMDVL